MNKKIVWNWELIDENPASATKRARVTGGWLVVHQTFHDLGTQKAVMSESSVFIHDTDWQWQPIEPYVDPQVVKANLAKDFKD